MIRRLKNFRLIRFIYYIYNYRLLYYLPMEMTKKEEKKSDWYWEIWDKKTNNPNEVIAWLIVEKAKLEEENKKLKEEIKSRQEEVERFKTNAVQDMAEITELEIENKKLKETIKDHQLYEEKLEHRIIEFEELLHWE